MKKVLLTLASALLLSGSAFADEASITFSEKGYTNGQELTTVQVNDQISLTFDAGDNKNSPKYYTTGTAARLYGGNTMNVTAVSGCTITEVTFKTGSSNVWNAASTASVGEFVIDGSAATWTGSASDVLFTQGGTSGHVRIESMTVTYIVSGPVKKAADLVFAEEAVIGYEGVAFTAPELTKATDGALTWTSSDEAVATVDENGVVTIAGVGSTTIKVVSAETETYYAGEASYNLTVKHNPEIVIYDNACTSEESGFTAVGADSPWAFDRQFGMKASGFVSGAATAKEGIMMSPVFNLEGRKNISLSFEHALNQFKENNVLIECTQENIDKYVSVMIAEVSDASDAPVWNNLSQALNITNWSWNFVEQTIDLSAYAKKQIRIGFRYVSTEAVAGTWEVKNVLVLGEKDVESAVESIVVDEDAAPVYYNLQGVRLSEPQQGINVVVRGGKASKVIVK